MKKFVANVTIMTIFGLSSIVAFAQQGNTGKVTFSGDVVESPCNLAPGQDGTDIKVPFGQLSMARLNDGEVYTKDFHINLQDCDLGNKKAQITFSSTDLITGKNLLGTRGSATGLGLGLSGIVFNTPANVPLLPKGDNTLTYTVTAQRVDNGKAVTAGTFQSIANFLISYQ
ncbi:type 1 fimbrial protein [Salmonella enterica subsp. enterica serovar Vom]|nr:type 1 fimbrial protein [Salmonella enterica subsp. enterica serovar Vom]